MNNNDKRTFPRSDMQCPVLYRHDENKPWKVGKMQNLSATGMCLITTDNPESAKKIFIHVKPGSQKIIPEIIASGDIIRIENINDEYVLACNLTNVSRG